MHVLTAYQHQGSLQLLVCTTRLLVLLVDVVRCKSCPCELNQLSVRAAAGDAGQVYTNITLYVLSQGMQGYAKLHKMKATRNQLQKMWENFAYNLVTRVQSQPAQLLTPATCPDAIDMDSVELEDGAQLALVLHQPLTFMGQLVDAISKNTEKVSGLLEATHGSHVRLL